MKNTYADYLKEATPHAMELLHEWSDQNVESMSCLCELLMAMYCEIPGVDPDDAYFAAKGIIDMVQEFPENFNCARENMNNYVEAFMDRMEADKTEEEIRNMWMSFITGLSAAENARDKADEQEAEEICNDEEQAYDVSLDELREMTREALMENHIMLSNLQERAQNLQGLNDGKVCIDYLHDICLCSITSMLMYRMIRENEEESDLEHFTPEMAALLVCAENERLKVEAAVEEGSMSVTMAECILIVLGCVVIIMSTATLMSTAMCAMAALSLPCILLMPAMAAVTVGILMLGMRLMEDWADSGAEIVARGMVTGIRTVVSGAKRLAAYVKEKTMNVHRRSVSFKNSNQVQNVHRIEDFA